MTEAEVKIFLEGQEKPFYGYVISHQDRGARRIQKESLDPSVRPEDAQGLLQEVGSLPQILHWFPEPEAPIKFRKFSGAFNWGRESVNVGEKKTFFFDNVVVQISHSPVGSAEEA